MLSSNSPRCAFRKVVARALAGGSEIRPLYVIVILAASIVSVAALEFVQATKASAAPLACRNAATLGCDVYDACFERACNCESTPDRYFITYGKKYCERFLAATDWSAAGRTWRDKTLLCLQEKIIPHLPLDGPAGGCDCGKMKALAFRTHVECYTQTGSSICDLGGHDWRKISGIIDINKDIFQDADGRRQLLAVTRICVDGRLDGAVKDLMLRILGALESADEPAKPKADEPKKKPNPPPDLRHQPDPRLCKILGTC